MSLRAEEGCSNLCCPCSLRACVILIGALNFFCMGIGVSVSPELLKETEYIITLSITLAFHFVLILAGIFQSELLLILWFMYAVEFLLGFPLRIESIAGYYRKLYVPPSDDAPIVLYIAEFIVVKSSFIYFMRMVCSYYFDLSESREAKLRVEQSVRSLRAPPSAETREAMLRFEQTDRSSPEAREAMLRFEQSVRSMRASPSAAKRRQHGVHFI